MYCFVKRVLDIIMSLIGLILLIPISLGVKIIFLLTNDFDSIFYKQKRIGKNNKEFTIYKYRTMIKDADKLLEETIKQTNTNFYEKYKIKDDPRLTKIGKFLRKLSIDEIPQVINVLKGEMSFVGPRPVTNEELNYFKKDKELFLSVKPGITGFWAVSGRNNLTYKERVEKEIYYVLNKGIALDTKILFKTFIVVITQKGAM